MIPDRGPLGSVLGVDALRRVKCDVWDTRPNAVCLRVSDCVEGMGAAVR